MSELLNVPKPEMPTPALNLPPLVSPGAETSEHALIANVTKWGQLVAVGAGTIATILASLALPPLAIAIPATIAGLGQLAAIVAPMRYSKDRTALKAAVAQAQQIAQDAKPIVDAIKAARK